MMCAAFAGWERGRIVHSMTGEGLHGAFGGL